MAQMHIPILRFPGGTDVDVMDWAGMIDMPAERAQRPSQVGNQGDLTSAYFGYDEAGQLAETLNADLLLVVNFGDAYFKRKPLKEAIIHELGLVSYMAASTDRKLPYDLNNWAQLRASNGHPNAYPVKYIQIANEPWVMDKDNIDLYTDLDEAAIAYYFTCLDAYVTDIETVFPELKIIVDANVKDLASLIKARYGERVDFVAMHQHMPWGVGEFVLGAEKLDRDALSQEQIWNAWITTPQINKEGLSYFGDDPQYLHAINAGYPVAMTEWNWNGWWKIPSKHNPDDTGSNLAKGLGAAGYLHAMMREADRFHLGIQSMLVGNAWGITGIKVSPDGAFAPHPLPSAQVTGLYARFHGNHMVKVTSNHVPRFSQPYEVNTIRPASVAVLDAVSSVSSDRIFVHVINRSFQAPVPVEIDISAYGVSQHKALIHELSGNMDNRTPCSSQPLRYACESTRDVPVGEAGKLEFTLAPRSVSVLEIWR